MSWRTVILATEAKLSLRMNHLVVTNANGIERVPLVELGVVIIENPNIVVTVHLLNQLAFNKTVVVLCDQSHNPMTVIQSLYGHHRQSKHIEKQCKWLDTRKGLLWEKIIRQKITNQAKVLNYIYGD